ncbi:hypothetical protein MUGA111182_03605 [Mucilaginibacter galii]|uniref:YD repeat-containing protein n=1 Tax=Mucilaginibacter galii TaxID=2005073 RepID=A0A917N1N3_9SPHI|nr:hypothetical protein [Mucilaginibacter galii]GGI51033.1 hypothetical protein GCM10011425_22450 [Mucilaginibacter galii]
MKPLLFILFLALFASCSSNEKNDISQQGLNGSIIKITETKYVAKEKFGVVSKGRLETTDVIEVNEQGNFYKEIYTSFPDPELDTVLGPEYNTKSEFITLSKFNDKGERISILDGKTNKVGSKYIYNEDGKVIEINNYNNEGKLSSKTKFTFDEGRLTQSNEYNSDGSLNSFTKYKMNENDKAIEAANFTNENKLSGKTTYSFNDNLITGYKLFKDNRLTDTYKFKYVKFDDHKNWTIKHISINNKIESIVEQKINYR